MKGRELKPFKNGGGKIKHSVKKSIRSSHGASASDVKSEADATILFK